MLTSNNRVQNDFFVIKSYWNKNEKQRLKRERERSEQILDLSKNGRRTERRPEFSRTLARQRLNSSSDGKSFFSGKDCRLSWGNFLEETVKCNCIHETVTVLSSYM